MIFASYWWDSTLPTTRARFLNAFASRRTGEGNKGFGLEANRAQHMFNFRSPVNAFCELDKLVSVRRAVQCGG